MACPRPQPMTDAQAAQEALRRWGKEGRAWHPHGEVRGGESFCVVGVSNGRLYPHQWSPRGVGVDWESAFADSDQREQS